MKVKLENWSFVGNDWSGWARYPYLHEFKPIAEGNCLLGNAYGHPKVIEGNRCHTSVVKSIDVGARTATTASGTVYELGAPYPDYVDAIKHLTYQELLKSGNN